MDHAEQGTGNVMRVRATLTLRNAALLRARKRAGLTQRACADAVGISLAVLTALEKMNYRQFKGEGPPAARRRRMAVDLALFFQVPLEEFLPTALIGKCIQSTAIREADISTGQLLCAGQSTQLLSLPASAAAERNEAAELLHKALRQLPTRSSQVLTLRYGLDGKGERTLKEIAATFGVTRERAGQLIFKAERDLSVPERIGMSAEAAGLTRARKTGSS